MNRETGKVKRQKDTYKILTFAVSRFTIFDNPLSSRLNEPLIKASNCY
jgi:hypothetical protein